jgi:hypothetical protein
MEYVLNAYIVATSLVTAASVVANYTDTPRMMQWVAKAYKLMESFCVLEQQGQAEVMIEVMAALAVANSAFKSVQTLMGRGAELEQMAGQLGRWYTAASDIRAAGELQKPSAFRRLVDFSIGRD